MPLSHIDILWGDVQTVKNPSSLRPNSVIVWPSDVAIMWMCRVNTPHHRSIGRNPQGLAGKMGLVRKAWTALVSRKSRQIVVVTVRADIDAIFFFWLLWPWAPESNFVLTFPPQSLKCHWDLWKSTEDYKSLYLISVLSEWWGLKEGNWPCPPLWISRI